MPKTSWNIHPRPQMKRQQWLSLNGDWLLEGNPITIPYPPQSHLSSYEGDISEQMNYEKCFTIPANWDSKRLLLHFGAADQVAEVWLNGSYLGKHEGGYLPFTFDISEIVQRHGENKLRVLINDSLDKTFPYGKQTDHPGGMWYTPVSGIWQSVWLEAVPEQYIRSLKLKPDLSGITIEADGISGGFTATINGKDYVLYENHGRIEIEEPILWTTEEPYLYDLTITAGEDVVESYFALRTIEIKTHSGVERVFLNDKPIFLHGVLDQGYFPDGLFLPEEPEGYEQDILRMKGLGMNLLRKHIKVEPEAFYHACDRLGMLVMQDMVNSGPYHYWRDTILPTLGFSHKSDKVKAEDVRQCFFRQCMKDTISHLYNHPCVIAYTIFNEGWGQFNSDELYDLAKSLDSSRLYDSTSGWFAQKKSDFDSQHIYFRLKKLSPKKRPLLVSECGGYTMPVPGHLYKPDKQYGYGNCKDMDELTDRIIKLYETMIIPAMKDGCCGCIYTQLSDVEEEINGFYTYDRRVRKVDQEKMQRLAAKLRYTMRSL